MLQKYVVTNREKIDRLRQTMLYIGQECVLRAQCCSRDDACDADIADDFDDFEVTSIIRFFKEVDCVRTTSDPRVWVACSLKKKFAKDNVASTAESVSPQVSSRTALARAGHGMANIKLLTKTISQIPQSKAVKIVMKVINTVIKWVSLQLYCFLPPFYSQCLSYLACFRLHM
jgi:hypothetical protein